jgi:hypothetical protein
MSSVTKDTIVDIFKQVYGGANDLRPKTSVLDDLFPFSPTQRVGDSYLEGLSLNDEVGYTLAGSAQDAFVINPAIAGSFKQLAIQPSQTVVSTVLSWGFMARSAAGGEASFFEGTKYVMKNNLESHNKLVNVFKLYGQSTERLGTVSYATATYRGVSFTNGSGTLTKKDGSTITFTNGINAAEKAILLSPGQFASGIFVGRKGAAIKQLDSSDVVVASGSIAGWDSVLGIVYVDFTPVAASSVGSHKLAFDGSESLKEMVGMQRILTNTGTLFGVSAVAEPLWSGTTFDVGGSALSLKAIQEGIADAVNAGGLDQPLDILVNPRSFARMSDDDAALRRYNSAESGKATRGFEAIEYYSANGLNKIHASSYVKEGDAFGVVREHWRCGGSQLPSFRVQGIDEDVIQPLGDQAGFSVRSYGDQYLLCRQPAKQVYWSGINDEGTLY